MKIALIVLVGLIALVSVLLVIGAMLPRKHVASREITVRRTAAEVYSVVRDFAGAPSWRTDLKKV